MNVSIVVGKRFRDLNSVRRFVGRLKKGTTVAFLNPLSSAGDVVAFHAAERNGLTCTFVTRTGNDAYDKSMQRVELVKGSDKVVVFDDTSKRAEHVVNLANANDKELVRFREV